MAARPSLEFAPDLCAKFDPYLPQGSTAPRRAHPASAPGAVNVAASCPDRPFVTLTYAVSLDAQIAAAPGTQTVLSGAESKAMTHYLRTRHDGIVVGAGTAIADDPTLNSRLASAHGVPEAQPRPIVLDRNGRWPVDSSSKVVQAAVTGHGQGPWVLVDETKLNGVPSSRMAAVESSGGSYRPCQETDMASVLALLKGLGIQSVMIEGGAVVINDILRNYLHLVDSVIITVAPVFLGEGGVRVCPPRAASNPLAIQFDDVTWVTLGADTVMCGRPRRGGLT